jgi:hypothetical protein
MALTNGALAQEAGGEPLAVSVRGTSPEALKALPAQDHEGRGRLMPLHSASVMEWVCGDEAVRTKAGGDRKACYAKMHAGVEECQVRMQGSLPTGRSKALSTGKPDIVAFRRQLRACIEESYVEREREAGKSAAGLVVQPAPDPLAGVMGGG